LGQRLGAIRGEDLEKLEGLRREFQRLFRPAQLAGIEIEHEIAELHLYSHVAAEILPEECRNSIQILGLHARLPSRLDRHHSRDSTQKGAHMPRRTPWPH